MNKSKSKCGKKERKRKRMQTKAKSMGGKPNITVLKSCTITSSMCEQETNLKGCLQLDVNNCFFGIGIDLCTRSIQNEWQHSNKHAV